MIQTRPTFRQQWEFIGMTAAVRLISLLPFTIVGWMAKLVGTLVWAVDGRGRRVARANLDTAFGEDLSAKRKVQIIRASYQAFARTMLELFWSSNLTPQRLDKLCQISGLDEVCHTDKTQPVIYLCLHASNFEWLSLALGHRLGPGIVVAQKFKNPLLGKVFDRLRSTSGHQLIPQERAMMRMLRHLKKGGYFCMVVDLNLDPKEASVVIDEFGGLKTCVTQMHAALALHTGAKIIPSVCHPLPDGTYKMVYHKPLEFPPDASAQDIAQLCWNTLEPSIREHPETWLWAYKHWRFKPSDEDSSRYPFYANTAKRFDKMLVQQALSLGTALVALS